MAIRPTILIAEAQRAKTVFLAAKLESGTYNVITAATGHEAINMAASYSPDLILLNSSLPDIGRAEMLQAIRKHSAAPVFIISSNQKEEDIAHALDCGADDYIVKPYSSIVLMARIRAVLRRCAALKAQRFSPAQPYCSGELTVDFEKQTVSISGERVHVTSTEYQIIQLLAANAGRVVTHKALLREVWGPYMRNNSILRVNIANLRRKIEKDPACPAYLFTEPGTGYRLAEGRQNNAG